MEEEELEQIPRERALPQCRWQVGVKLGLKQSGHHLLECLMTHKVCSKREAMGNHVD